MELWTLVFVILGFSFSFCSILVDSQDNVNVPSQPSVVTTPLPPPPPPSPSPPPLSQPPPPPQTPSPPPPSPLPGRPPPPPKPRTRRPNSLPHSKKNATMSPQSNHNLHNEAVSRDKHGGKKAQHEHITSGKKVGLLFIGVAGVLQICVAGFLIFKWQQLIAKDQG